MTSSGFSVSPLVSAQEAHERLVELMRLLEVEAGKVGVLAPDRLWRQQDKLLVSAFSDLVAGAVCRAEEMSEALVELIKSLCAVVAVESERADAAERARERYERANTDTAFVVLDVLGRRPPDWETIGEEPLPDVLARLEFGE